MCHGAQARIAARRNPVAQGNTKLIYPVIHSVFDLELYFLAIQRSSALSVGGGWLLQSTADCKILQSLRQMQGCAQRRGDCGRWLCVSFVRVTVVLNIRSTTTTGRG